MTLLYLVRHGRTDWNEEGRYQGHLDPPLNAKGREQARTMVQALRQVPFAAIYSSDLQRARETAEALAAGRNLSVRLDPRLREIDVGEWQGLLFTDIMARDPELFKRWDQAPSTMRLPGGETLAEVEARVWAALDDIAAAYPVETVAVTAHGVVISIVRCRLYGRPLDKIWKMKMENAAWEVVEWPLKKTS